MVETLISYGFWIVLGFFLLLILKLMAPLLRRKTPDSLTLQGNNASQKLHSATPLATLAPIIDPDVCIGSGECVSACPEQDVLGLKNGKGVIVSPSNCMGHGLCTRACPVNAISLEMGSNFRGVDLPRIQENFETNVPGIFIVGELAGMGLIKNAFEQARQCVEYYITKEKPTSPEDDVLDVVIIGCGPAGLSATIYAKNKGLRFKTLEREDIGGTVRYYPRRKVVFTTPLRVPNYGTIHRNHMHKEELIQLWKDIVEREKLDEWIETDAGVQKITKLGSHFVVESDRFTLKTRQIIIAIGRQGTPRKLGIKGENLPNVSYNLLEPDHFQHLNVCVVGGGDSAIEAALALSDQPGNNVAISYRGDTFKRAKETNRQRIMEASRSRKINILFETNVIENQEEAVLIQNKNGHIRDLTNDYLFILAGGDLPTKFLTESGIQIDTKFGEPRFPTKIPKAAKIK